MNAPDESRTTDRRGFHPELQRRLPPALRRYILHFEAATESAVTQFAASLARGACVLDAGAGEGTFSKFFPAQRYVSLDLGIGDEAWNYGGLDVIGDLHRIPFQSETFDACINVVTLEHVREPSVVMCELARILKPGGRLMIVAPHQWEEHQQPHDYYRYTRYGLEYLMNKAGLGNISIDPVGGFFRMLSRRLLNSLQFFPSISWIPAALLFGPPALIMPVFDSLDKKRNFTLGYICTAEKL